MAFGAICFAVARAIWIGPLLVLASATLPVGASPLQHPKRVVALHTVDLGPLFKWWAKHDGPRPLSSWVHITGSIVGTNTAGWIVEGQIEETTPNRQREKTAADSAHGPAKIILRSPPLDDLVEFEQLSSKLDALKAQRASLTAQESDAKSRQRAVANQERTHPRNEPTARVLAREARQLKKAESEAKAQEKPLDQQIQELKSRLAAYPSSDRYTIDCFALDLLRDYQNLPVYEHGQVPK